MPNAAIHPTSQELTAFTLGKLDDPAEAAVARHLETCCACRQVIEKLPADSFVGKVRAAKPSVSALPARASGATNMPATATPKDLPPDLANYSKYRFVRELGRGGMGVVYQAEQTVMGRAVTVKVINPSVLDHPDALPRFQSEVRAAAKLDHPNIVRAHDAEQVGSMHLLVMEYVEGASLADLVAKKGPLSVAYACHYIRQAALGLQHAFEQGMVHRDVKPHNLMVNARGQVKVLDFGLARMRSERKAGRGLTQADAFMGTPEYVSPEQATDARSADTRADIYSLGCTLFFLLAGRPPFQSDTAVKLIMAHIEKEAPSLHELCPEVPLALSAVVARMLAKDPACRFQTPVEVAQALAAFIKLGTKQPGAGVVPSASGVSSPVTGTAIGADTSKIKAILRDVPGKAPAPDAPAKAEAASVFAGLGESVASAKRKEKPGRKAAKPVADAALPSSQKKWLRGGGIGVGVLLLALLGMWASGVIKVKTKDGTIVLENLSPDAEVLVDDERVSVTWGGGGRTAEVHIKPGTRRIVARRNGVMVVGEEVEIADGGRMVLSAKMEPARVAPAKDPLDRWFAVGTRWEGEAAIAGRPSSSVAQWFTVLSREGNKFKGRLVGEGRADLNIEGTLGNDGTSFRWTNFREMPNVWRPQPLYKSFMAEGKCMAERTRIDWKSTTLQGQEVEGYSEFTIRRYGPRKDDEEVWPPPLHPRRASIASAGKWRVEGDELVQEVFIADWNKIPAINFGDVGWKDYNFHFKAMRTAGDDGFRVDFDGMPRKATQWCIGCIGRGGSRVTLLELVELLPTGAKFPPLSEHKPCTIVNNRWYDILIKTRGQWVECILDGKSIFKVSHPDRWGGKVAFGCMRMAGRFKDIEVTDPNGKVLWKKGPPELP